MQGGSSGFHRDPGQREAATVELAECLAIWQQARRRHMRHTVCPMRFVNRQIPSSAASHRDST